MSSAPVACRVVVTTSEGSLAGLARRLGGVVIREHPLLSFGPPPDWRPLDDALARLDRFSALVLTSRHAAEAIMTRLRGHYARLPPRRLRPACWVAGKATGASLAGRFALRAPPPASVRRHGAAASLAAALLRRRVRSPVLYACGSVRRDELPVRLRDAGITVHEVVCYTSVLATLAKARAALRGADVVVVGSARVGVLVSAAARGRKSRPRLVALGPTTAAACRRAGWEPDVTAPAPTPQAVTQAVRSVARGAS